MSPVNSILGIRDLLIDRVERGPEVHVWAKSAKRLACAHCQQASVRIKAAHQRTLKHTRQGNQFAGIRPRRRATEAYRLEVFKAHDGGVSQRQLTRTHRIGSATVERWYQFF